MYEERRVKPEQRGLGTTITPHMAAQLHLAGPFWRGRSHLECVAQRRLDSDDRCKGGVAVVARGLVLTLGRVGKTPRVERLCTEEARDPVM